ncbi:hypothetical protein ACJX0J_041347, partial [Zea mays]
SPFMLFSLLQTSLVLYTFLIYLSRTFLIPVLFVCATLKEFLYFSRCIQKQEVAACYIRLIVWLMISILYGRTGVAQKDKNNTGGWFAIILGFTFALNHRRDHHFHTTHISFQQHILLLFCH